MPQLYLIPNTLDDDNYGALILPELTVIVPTLRHFICENAKPARRRVLAIYQAAGKTVAPDSLMFYPLTEHQNDQHAEALLIELAKNQAIGLLSDAGCPAIADPGSVVVRTSHRLGWTVKPLVGGISLMLALMASGLNGQQFRFVGYLDRRPDQRRSQLKHIDKHAHQQTTLIIETPYRNQSFLNDCLSILSDDTWLCLAIGLTTPAEQIISKPIQQWRTQTINLPKVPAVFVIGRP